MFVLIRTSPKICSSVRRVTIHNNNIPRVGGGLVSIQQRTMKVYTKTGDKGTTSLYTGERREKDNMVFDALGAVDELNAGVGMALSLWEVNIANTDDPLDMKKQLEEVMSRLFEVGAAVATPRDTSQSKAKLSRTEFKDSHVEDLEKSIDAMTLVLEPLKNFILPSGGVVSSQFHVARTLARTAERRVWPLIRAGAVDEVIGRYVNRLSDYLFTAARYSCKLTGGTEKIYKRVVDNTNT